MAEAVQQLVSQIEKLSVAELVDLIKDLEDKFDVKSFAMAMAATAAPVTAGGDAAAGQPAAGTKVNISLTDAGANKIGVIKVIKEIKPDLSLGEAKKLVDSAPSVIIEGVDAAEAKEIIQKLVTAGGKAEAK